MAAGDGVTAARLGVCRACDGLRKLTKKGLLVHHGTGRKGVWPPESCEGTGEPPVDDEPGEHTG